MDIRCVRYYRIWLFHSILYSFSTTISMTYYQAYAIKVLGFDVDSVGNITFLNLAMTSLGNVMGPLLVN